MGKPALSAFLLICLLSFVKSAHAWPSHLWVVIKTLSALWRIYLSVYSSLWARISLSLSLRVGPESSIPVCVVSPCVGWENLTTGAWTLCPFEWKKLTAGAWSPYDYMYGNSAISGMETLLFTFIKSLLEALLLQNIETLRLCVWMPYVVAMARILNPASLCMDAIRGCYGSHLKPCVSVYGCHTWLLWLAS